MTEAQILLEFIKLSLPDLLKFKKPLTEEEARRLIGRFGLLHTQRQLSRLHNYNGSERKYKSVYETTLKWFDMDIKKGYYSEPEPEIINVPSPEEDLKLKFLKKYPIGTTYKSRTGATFTIINETFACNDEGSYVPINLLINRR
jgi:hypothetical protein